MIKTPATEAPAIAHSMIADIMEYLNARLDRITPDQIDDDDTDYLPAATGLLDAFIRATCLQGIGDMPDALTELLDGLNADEDHSDHHEDFYTLTSEIKFSHPTAQALAATFD